MLCTTETEGRGSAESQNIDATVLEAAGRP